MTRAFTILETLVAFVIVVIGFSGLYYWFITHSTLQRHAFDRAYAQHMLQNQAEYLSAFPRAAHDSTWTTVVRGDTFHFEQTVIDSAKRADIFKDSSWTTGKKNKVLMAPIEVKLGVHKTPARIYTGEELYLLVGGIAHVAP
jgi:Tfp pilus assembly protein PilV